MDSTQPNDLIRAEEARAILGVSSAKMAHLIKQGLLPHWTYPLDRRVKLVSRADVQSLTRPKKAEAA
jgi:predicted DNA-binding transcriptional regulator AlpA